MDPILSASWVASSITITVTVPPSSSGELVGSLGDTRVWLCVCGNYVLTCGSCGRGTDKPVRDVIVPTLSL